MPIAGFSLKKEQVQRQKLSMKTYIPLLKCEIKELYDELKKLTKNNPSIEIKESSKKSVSLDTGKKRDTNRRNYGEFREDILESKESLYEKLESQIVDSIFPTSISKSIAREIIENINNEGFFDGDIKTIAKFFDVEERVVESIRERFSLLEPIGIGAKDYKESFIFQLDELEIEEELYQYCKELILDFENLKKYSKDRLFKNAKKILTHFKNPPAIEYLEDSKTIIPEVLVIEENGNFKVTLNSSAYPEIEIKNEAKFSNSLKSEAKNIFNLIELRKSTLLKISEVLVTKQIEFFKGGELKALNMEFVADIVGVNQSTISRAISKKYLSSQAGTFELKYLFASNAKEGITSTSIKNFIKELIEDERAGSTLKDEELSKIVHRKFGVDIARRTVGKYRKELNIPNKREREEILKIKES